MAQLSSRLSKLSPEQLQKLHRKLHSVREERGGTSPNTIARRPRDQGPFPLSYAQRRLWLFEQLWPGTATYNVPASVRLRGPLRVDLLGQAFRSVVERHEILRTRIFLDGREPVQEVVADLELTMPIVELGALEEPDRERSAVHALAVEATLPFTIDRDRLVRLWLIRLGPEDHVLSINMHHLVCDNWSQAVFVRDLTAFYTAFYHQNRSELPELPIQYIDYAAWQREWLSGRRLEKELDYWRETLRDAPPVLDLPLDRPRPAQQSFRGELFSRRFPRPAFERLAEDDRATFFTSLLAAFKAALHVFTGLEDILVGSPVSGRERAGTEGLIGFFSNTLVLRSDLSGDPSLREVQRREGRVVLDAFAHQNTPFDKLLEELKIPREPSHPPLFQVNFLLERRPERPFELPGLKLSQTHHSHKTAKFDINVFMSEDRQGLRMAVLYSRDIFDQSTIERLAEIYGHCLETLAKNPDERLSALAAKIPGPPRKPKPTERKKKLKASNLKKLDKLRRRSPST